MWFTTPGILLLFLYVNPTVSKDICSDLAMKDAILSLARVMKDNSQKLERHEARERQLGDFLKKTIGALSKKVSDVDTFAAQFSKFEDQMSEIEQLISQRDERERIQIQKTTGKIENLEHRLESRLNEIKNLITEVSQHVEATEPTTTAESVSALDIISKLNDNEAHILEKIARIEFRLDDIAAKNKEEVDKNKEEAAKQAEKLQTVFSERHEKDKTQMEKTEKLLENLESRLEMRLEQINNTIHYVNEHVEPTEPTTTTESVTALDIMSKLNDAGEHFLEKVAVIESRLNSIVTKNKDDVTKESENLGNIFTEVQNITSRLADIESSLEKVREDARKEAEKPVEEPIDIGAIIEKQTKALEKVTDLVVNTMNRMEDMPSTSVVLALHNETQSALQEAKSTLQIAVEDRLNGLIKNVSGNNEDIKDSIGHLRSDLANNTEHVNAKLRDIANAQMVMVSTADQVLDLKRQLEFGLLQVLLEVGELVNGTGTVLNTTLNDRFDRLSKAIGNSTNILEQELEMVWRHINAMQVQSTQTLEKFNKQNEAHANGIISTMDGMENKVGDMTKRMSEVDNNLNFLLGRLSLVSQEFTRIKSGLVTALDDIKASFKEVQEKAKDLSTPGLHPLPENYVEPDDVSYPATTSPNQTALLVDLPAN